MSFFPISPHSDFPLSNLPWGIFQDEGHNALDLPPLRPCVALGDYVVDMWVLASKGLLTGPQWSSLSKTHGPLQQSSLNQLMGLGRPWWQEARASLQRLLSAQEGVIRDDQRLRQQAIIPMDQVTMQLPAQVGDYTDFYASKEHATNVGRMFRPGGQALNPNWVHQPIAYHGRASSVVVSGMNVKRPLGQILPHKEAEQPIVAPSRALDFELEMAAFVGKGNALGESISVEDAWRQHIFGLVLMNDWSARDIQKWEYQPLGPFNGKNWATQISPWIVTTDALEPFFTEAPLQSPPVLPYMQEETRRSLPDIDLQVDVTPEGVKQASCVSKSNLKYMYWTFSQMVAHHTLGGCNLRPGDLLGTGTVSGPEPHQCGSLLELTHGGTKPLSLDQGSTSGQLGYLRDGDEVVLKGFCAKEGLPRIGFGECRGKVLPARLP
uniref:Fumarylacetoacetase n=1 Tax=Dunaliella tertiolecta TaxID=3047 RepID=A0A6S8JSU9_DUNTE